MSNNKRIEARGAQRVFRKKLGIEWAERGSGHTDERNRRGRKKYANSPSEEEVARLISVTEARADARRRAIANAKRRVDTAEIQMAEAVAAVAHRKITDGDRDYLAELWAEVEMRRQELKELQDEMVASPQSAEHRGTRSFRPVPDMSRGVGW